MLNNTNSVVESLRFRVPSSVFGSFSNASILFDLSQIGVNFTNNATELGVEYTNTNGIILNYNKNIFLIFFFFGFFIDFNIC